MPHTETFYVSLRDNAVRPVTDNVSSYFSGKNMGKAKYCIEVFGYDHKEVASKIRDIIDKEDLSEKLYVIKVSTR